MPPADQNQPTQKQQVTELLKQAQTVLITTSKNPGVDEIAAVIALSQMLEKTGKRAENVVSAPVPSGLDFLPQNIIHKEFAGLRDFVIELDTSKTEADKLKYIPEEKRLKIFITPYNGTFTKEDLGFSYGDYHCDVVVVLGAKNLEQADAAVVGQSKLLEKAKTVFINVGTGAQAGGHQIAWTEPQATSLCEVLMSLTEALQPGLLDNKLATSLLTGIVAKTNHFTATNTTPKVMTMAAQLLAAGADQHMIVEHLTKSEHVKPQATAGQGELKPSQERDLPNTPVAPPVPPPPPQPKVFDPTPDLGAPAVPPQTPPSTHRPVSSAPPPPPNEPRHELHITPPPEPPPIDVAAMLSDTPPPPPAQPVPPPAEPPKPASGLWGEPPVVQPQARAMASPPVPSFDQAQPLPPPVTPSQPLDTPPVGPKIDIEAARRAVDEATREAPPPIPPDPNQPPVQ